MFSLYCEKDRKVIEISPIKNNAYMLSKATNEVTQYNNCFYICNDRKLLREKAIEIQNEWIEETERELNAFRQIKVKNKY